MIRKVPKDGTRKFKRKFALLPVYTKDGWFVWLGWYYQEYTWSSYSKSWNRQWKRANAPKEGGRNE